MSGCYICGDNDTVVVEVCNDCVIESESSPQHEMNRNMAESFGAEQIDLDDFYGHTPGEWNVSKAQRNTVLVEANALGCSDCGSTDIYTHENTGGKEIQFPNSVEPRPFTIPEGKDWRMGYRMYCPDCDLYDYAKAVDATQIEANIRLIEAAPMLLAELKRMREGQNAEEFGVEGKVRTMSGKPHTPRKLVKDKNITPKEAAKRMKLEAETFNALDMELDRNDCCELWVEKMYDNGRIGFGEASNLLASIEMDGLKCSSLGSSNCSKENMGAESFGAEEGTFYDEGRTAANAVFMPEMKDRESFGLMDSEYMVFFDLTPDELVSDIDNNSKRYTQFSWGWGQEWDKLNMDSVLNESTQDDDFYDHSAETFPDITDAKTSLVLLGAVLVGIIGASKITKMSKAETFQASQSCNEDSDCDEGFVCVDGECMKTCIDDGDCASWQECRDDLHPTENVCGEDKTDSDENPFANLINNGDSNVGQPNDAPTQEDESYSTTTKAVFGVGIVGAIVIGIKVLGGMQDKER